LATGDAVPNGNVRGVRRERDHRRWRVRFRELGEDRLTALASRAPTRWRPRRILPIGHRTGFALQGLAYGANDGQKMLAIAILSGVTGPQIAGGRSAAVLTAIGVLFLVGSLAGLRRYSSTLGAMAPMTAVSTATASTSAALAVLMSSAIGIPVSMTQATAGGLVGTGLSTGHRRIRWDISARILQAWAVTLPAGAALGAGLAVALP
jgi:inorganic phosphate transporter, PiT family